MLLFLIFKGLATLPGQLQNPKQGGPTNICKCGAQKFRRHKNQFKPFSLYKIPHFSIPSPKKENHEFAYTIAGHGGSHRYSF